MAMMKISASFRPWDGHPWLHLSDHLSQWVKWKDP